MKYSDEFNEFQRQISAVQSEFKKQMHSLSMQFFKVDYEARKKWADKVPAKFEVAGEVKVANYFNDNGTYRICIEMTQDKAIALKNENVFLHNATTCDAESDGPCLFPNTHDFIHNLMKISTEIDTR